MNTPVQDEIAAMLAAIAGDDEARARLAFGKLLGLALGDLNRIADACENVADALNQAEGKRRDEGAA